MKRFWPHLLVVLAGGVCLATIWSWEPPINVAPRARAAKMAPAPETLFVRVWSEQDLRAVRLTLRLSWDPRRLSAPRVYRAQQTWNATPTSELCDDEITIEFSAQDPAAGDRAPIRPIRGPGRLARLAFPFKRGAGPVGLDAVKLVEASAEGVDGVVTPLGGLRIATFEPKGDLDEAVQPVVEPPAPPPAPLPRIGPDIPGLAPLIED